MDVVAIKEAEIAVGGEAKGFLLALVDRLGRAAETDIGAGADLDEDEDFSQAADEIDLALGGQEIPVEDAIAMAAEKGGGDPLTIIPDLLRRRKARRWSTLGSVENRGDEWRKGREG